MTGIKYKFYDKEYSVFTKMSGMIFLLECIFYEIQKKDHELLVGTFKEDMYFKNYKL